jgi:hypothetical protein
MRKQLYYFVCLFLVVFVGGCHSEPSKQSIQVTPQQLTSVTPPIVVESALIPKRRDYKLDVKTNASGLIENFGVKAGLSSYIQHARPKWATVVEFGETYAVWIRNVNRTMKRGMVYMSFDLMISKPAIIYRESSIIAQRRITVPAFNPTVDPKGGDEAIRQKLENYAKTANVSKTGAMIFADITLLTGRSPLSAMLVFLSRFIPSPDQVQQQKVEGIIIGGMAYTNLQEMIATLEN